MKTIFQIIHGLKQPDSFVKFVLYKAIKNKTFNHYSLEYYGTSKRVHDLRNMGCEFTGSTIWRKNSYGHMEEVLTYELTNRNFAIELYKSLTK